MNRGPVRLPPGLKKQIFGTVLLAIGLFNITLDNALGRNPDLFHSLLVVVGLPLFIFGGWQKKQSGRETPPETNGLRPPPPETG